MIPLNIPEFIKKFVTKRTNNFFEADCLYHQATLTRAIKGKSILVIGGAGTIGTNYIKAALKFFPSEVIVVDTNENGLTALTRLLRSSADVQMPERLLPIHLHTMQLFFTRCIKVMVLLIL